jgi:hypothetical protein
LLLNQLNDVLGGESSSAANRQGRAMDDQGAQEVESAQVVRRYFQQLSSLALAAIADYEYRALEHINRPLTPVHPPNLEPSRQERQQLEVLLAQLCQALEAA